MWVLVIVAGGCVWVLVIMVLVILVLVLVCVDFGDNSGGDNAAIGCVWISVIMVVVILVLVAYGDIGDGGAMVVIAVWLNVEL